MDELHASTLELLWISLTAWFQQHVLAWSNMVQVVVAALAFGAALLVAPRVAAWAERRSTRPGARRAERAFLHRVATLAQPLVWLLLVWLLMAIAIQAQWPNHVLQIIASLTTAWLLIRLASTFIKDPAWSKFLAVLAWSVAALSTLGLLDATLSLLDAFGFQLGTLRISALTVIKGVLALVVLLWLAFGASNVLETRINRMPNLTPSVQVLFGKLAKIGLITAAVLLALDSVGIDLTAFTIFGGALGVGLGFGLQKIVSNLVSGVILLLDKSIKPGDVITVGDTYGWIVSLGARYASVRTRDGTEHLIPNEELIVQRVENWTHSDKAVRLRIPVGVHYKSDVRLAIKLCLEAASEVKRVLDEPRSVCLLKGFGDSSVDLEIRIWIMDPENGRSNVMSEVLLLVWDKFHANDIEIPYPQRDLHVRSPEVLQIASGHA